ncbi:MAG TPA: M23 family metallopeptidase [Bacillota bacterium]
MHRVRRLLRLLVTALLAGSAVAGVHLPRAAAAPRGPTLDLPAPAGAEALPPPSALPLAVRFGIDPGGIAALRLRHHPPAAGAQPRVWLDDQPQAIWRAGGHWLALIPVSYWIPPGPLPVRFAWTLGDQILAEARFNLIVVDKAFPVDHLQVSGSLAARRSDDRLQADAVRTQAARSRSAPEPLWDGPFAMPLGGRRSSEFGVIRMLNGTPTGRHSGLDLAAPEGTPVRAAATGRVVLADWLYVTGGTVIVDHGLGVFTSYAHLSRIAVTEGQRVRQGDVLGDVGATGFATGPHLHWSAWVGHTPVNPEDLLHPPLADLLASVVPRPVPAAGPARPPTLPRPL